MSGAPSRLFIALRLVAFLLLVGIVVVIVAVVASGGGQGQEDKKGWQQREIESFRKAEIWAAAALQPAAHDCLCF